MNVAFKVGFGGTASLILLIAKLVGVFPFSWWWVAMPVLLAYAFTFFIILFAALALDNHD